ncbi:uncharacterized protein A4U43_UnF9270 [Asparagus officinalis]|uniref:Uncharacterized protein n=1 Tax=Asparagus officinalis TaxID=4686 RepID=A0A1R3L5R8_ASPOF|nr:uncharacterized protein A4U43_UnF9270 [Asparagus officinalis]
MMSMLIVDQQVLVQSAQPIILEGTIEVAITISFAEEEKEEEEVDYSGDPPIEAPIQTEEAPIQEKKAPIQEEEAPVSSMCVVVVTVSTHISTTLKPVIEATISSWQSPESRWCLLQLSPS